MTPAIVVLVVAGLIAAWYVVRPLFADDAIRPERGPVRAGEARDLQGEYDMLVASLRDLEDDRATGKLRDEDYAELRGKLSARAVEVMKKLDALAEEERRASAPLPHPGARPPGPA